MVSLLLATAEVVTEAATTLTPEVVGIIIASVIASLGGGYMAGKKTHIANDPLNVEISKTYVTRQEHDDDIRELRNTLRDAESNTHKRLDAITMLLHEIKGQVNSKGDAV